MGVVNDIYYMMPAAQDSSPAGQVSSPAGQDRKEFAVVDYFKY